MDFYLYRCIGWYDWMRQNVLCIHFCFKLLCANRVWTMKSTMHTYIWGLSISSSFKQKKKKHFFPPIELACESNVSNNYNNVKTKSGVTFSMFSCLNSLNYSEWVEWPEEWKTQNYGGFAASRYCQVPNSTIDEKKKKLVQRRFETFRAGPATEKWLAALEVAAILINRV